MSVGGPAVAMMAIFTGKGPVIWGPVLVRVGTVRKKQARVRAAFMATTLMATRLPGCSAGPNCLDTAQPTTKGAAHPMQNVILLVHLLITLTLIGVVLLQRSEGGGLGMGGGGGGGMKTGRAPGTALGKMTWILGFALFATSLSLTIIAAQNAGGASVLDRITDAPAPVEAPEGAPGLSGAGDGLLPPSAGDDAPLTPTAD